MVLSSMSKYFKARLESGLEPQTSPNGISASPAAPLELRVPMELAELEAAEVLFRCMYGATAECAAKLVIERGAQNSAAAGAQMALFLRAYRLADRFEAVQCMDVFSRHINGFKPADITLDAALVFFGLQPALRDRLKKMGITCSQVLLLIFGDAPSVIRSPHLTAQFESLPHAAVLDWSLQDNLLVHSENCVVYLLSAWVNKHPDISTKEANQLACNIRVLHLSDAYLHTLLPNLEWMKNFYGMKNLPTLHFIRLGTLSKAHHFHPSSWISKPQRKQSSTASSPLVFELSGPASAQSALPQYMNGLWIKPSYSICYDYVNLKLALDFPKELGQFTNVWKAFGQACAIVIPEVLRQDNRTYQKCSHGSWKENEFQIIHYAPPFSSSSSIMQRRPNLSMKDTLAPYLVDGNLLLRVTIPRIK